MRIAFLLPSLRKTAPITVAANIIRHLKDRCEITVFYFKDSVEVDLGVPTQQLDFFKPHSFRDFDILHTHMFRADMYVMRYARQIECKTVVTLHSFIKEDMNNQYSFPKNFLVTQSWMRAVKKHDAIVCLTQYMKQYYSGKYGSKPMYVVNNGIEPESLKGTLTPAEEQEMKALKSRYKIIGTASTLTRLKGLEIIIAFLQERKDYAWYAPGEGNFCKTLKAYAKKAGVEDRCIFPGYKENIAAYYPWYDVFAFPSRSEGFGLSIAEAAYFKRPIVCSDMPVFRELFTEEEVAFFTLDDSTSFGNAVKKLEASATTFGENAWKRVNRDYLSQKMAEAYYQIYTEVTARHAE